MWTLGKKNPVTTRFAFPLGMTWGRSIPMTKPTEKYKEINIYRKSKLRCAWNNPKSGLMAGDVAAVLNSNNLRLTGTTWEQCSSKSRPTCTG
jgi:hypothetical protein